MADPVNSRELSAFMPLNALSPDNLKELAGKSRRVRIKAGRDLFRAGEDSSQQWFLVEGRIELTAADGGRQQIEAGTPGARNSLNAGASSARTAVARTDVTAIGVDRNLLDVMLTWDQAGNYRVEEIGENGNSADDADWMVRLLRTEAFHRIPPGNIQAIFMRMEAVAFNAGDVVIKQGEQGDFFYIIRDGRCLVTRSTAAKPEGVKLAELGPGDSFGEEALISDKERNATVTMLARGNLMRLSKADFNALLHEPLQDWIDFEDAVALVGQGARWLDVRLPAEYESGHVRNAANLPLFFLRMKADQLDPGIEYIVYCDTSRRSAAASFLLGERGLKTRILRGGLANVPGEAVVAGKRSGG